MAIITLNIHYLKYIFCVYYKLLYPGLLNKYGSYLYVAFSIRLNWAKYPYLKTICILVLDPGYISHHMRYWGSAVIPPAPGWHQTPPMSLYRGSELPIFVIITLTMQQYWSVNIIMFCHLLFTWKSFNPAVNSSTYIILKIVFKKCRIRRYTPSPLKK